MLRLRVLIEEGLGAYLAVAGLTWLLAISQALAWWPSHLWLFYLKHWSWSQLILLDLAADALTGRPRLSPVGKVGATASWLALYAIVGIVLFWVIERAFSVRVGKTIWHRAWASWTIVHIAYWLVAVALYEKGIVTFY